MSDYDEIQARLARENAMIWVGEVERLHNKVIKQAATIARLLKHIHLAEHKVDQYSESMVQPKESA